MPDQTPPRPPEGTSHPAPAAPAPQRRTSRGSWVAALVGAAILAVLIYPDDRPAEPAAPSATAPAPEPAPEPTPVPEAEPESEDEPAAPLPPPGPDERIVGATFEYEEPPRADDAGARQFSAPGTVRDDRLSCIDVEVVITAVDAGPGTADRRIASELLAAAEEMRSDWESQFVSEADCRLDDGSPMPRHGDLHQSLSEEPCELPGGPPLRCFTLGQSSFAAGNANVFVDADQLVLDATDGTLLGIEEVLALVGIDHQEAEASVGRIACLLDGADESCLGRPRLARGRPTAAGLVIEYGKAEAGAGYLGARTLFVPWNLLGLETP